jgi:signal transduction histidine kinase
LWSRHCIQRVAGARQRQEHALVAERRAAEIKTEFVSMVTHELRTPLTNIAGFAMTMRDTWSDLSAEEADEFLRIIVGEAELLANLVEDVLAIPRLEAGRLLVEATDFQLQPAAFRITDLIFPAGGDRSASVALSGRVRVHADPNRVEQILRNLLENARKYGGNEIRVDATRLENEWVIVVADNGSGVPPEHRDRIFGAFEQGSGGDARAESGFGLGLAVARHLVEAMGGRIWYEPGFPVGADSVFTLPAAADRRQRQAA